MRVAVIGDVHGNLPALEAVLADIRRRRADALWNLGDLVGYGPDPEEAIHRLREAKALSVAGNFDLKVLAVDRREPAKDEPVEKWMAPVWARENLSPASLRYLGALPRERRIALEGHTFLLTHGSPVSITERLEPTTNEERLAELARAARAEYVLCSHSHMPFVRQASGTTFVNSGGVGRSDDRDARASYALLDVGPDGVSVVQHRVPYDVSRVAEALERFGLPDAYGRMLLESRTLEAVLQDPDGHLPGSSAARARTLDNVLALARSCRYEVGHSHQVTRLALDLFDRLEALHGCGEAARRRLLYASLLHDIGWLEGAKGHHKASQRIIESSRELPLGDRDRRIIACIARYHRGALPKRRHRPFGQLSSKDRQEVMRVSALLRLADGLDRSHRSVVTRVSTRVRPRTVEILCETRGAAKEERTFGLKKGDLFTKVYGRELSITCSRR